MKKMQYLFVFCLMSVVGLKTNFRQINCPVIDKVSIEDRFNFDYESCLKFLKSDNTLNNFIVVVPDTFSQEGGFVLMQNSRDLRRHHGAICTIIKNVSSYPSLFSEPRFDRADLVAEHQCHSVGSVFRLSLRL